METKTVRLLEVRTSSSINTACCHVPSIKTPPFNGRERDWADDGSPNVRPPVTVTPDGIMGIVMVVWRYHRQGTAQALEYPTLVLDRPQSGCRPMDEEVGDAVLHSAGSSAA